jgi:hypothetical protein
VDSGRGFVGHPYLGTLHLFGSFQRARLEHQLQRADALVGDRDGAAGQHGFGVHLRVVLLLKTDLDLAPVQQALQVAQDSDGQRQTGWRSLGSIDLLQDHLYARLSRVQHLRLRVQCAATLGQNLALLVQQPLALFEGDFECGVGSRLHSLIRSAAIAAS